MRRDDAVERLRRLLAERLGLSFDPNRDPQLAEVLHQRAAQHALSDRGYLDRLSTAWHAELAALAEAVTVNETYFFRNIEQFRALTEVALPQLVRGRARERRLRLLSVGCSTGEEVYTLAIVTAERIDPRWDVSIVGLDVHRAALRTAAAGRYSTWSLRETPPATRERWFRSYGDQVEVDPRLRGRVRFLEHNLVRDDPVLFAADAYDVVFCRNVLMYLTPDVARDTVERITRALAPGGHLFLGHTDTLGSRPAGLAVRHSHGTFYYERVAAPPAEAHHVQSPKKTISRPKEESPQALQLIQQERFRDALDVLDRMPAADAERPANQLVRAAVLAHLGDTGRAAALCRLLLERDALNADAHHLLAECCEGDDDPAAALEHHRLAAHLDGGFAMPRLRLGLLARRLGDQQAAERELDHAVALLRHETEERIVLFGGGFSRGALIALCHAELAAAR